MNRKQFLHASLATLVAWRVAPVARAADPAPTAAPAYLARAQEVTAAIHAKFRMPKQSLNRNKPGSESPEMAWGSSVLFSMLVGASRHQPQTYQRDLLKFHDGINRYWDTGVKIPG